ncbi:hypothetical protein Nepgr_027200 [Nepenthes gracilis]|uniref:Uncharacterized protein n=1 Tax=Nepenthes gracilis TaxID=150966 RepID=A0AAD3T9L9_NEPGR|nr:hypothetical protein Nepgr_027200 [Nepenthes gracilis]
MVYPLYWQASSVPVASKLNSNVRQGNPKGECFMLLFREHHPWKFTGESLVVMSGTPKVVEDNATVAVFLADNPAQSPVVSEAAEVDSDPLSLGIKMLIKDNKFRLSLDALAPVHRNLVKNANEPTGDDQAVMLKSLKLTAPFSMLRWIALPMAFSMLVVPWRRVWEYELPTLLITLWARGTPVISGFFVSLLAKQAAVLCWHCGWGRDATDDCFAVGGKLGVQLAAGLSNAIFEHLDEVDVNTDVNVSLLLCVLSGFEDADVALVAVGSWLLTSSWLFPSAGIAGYDFRWLAVPGVLMYSMPCPPQYDSSCVDGHFAICILCDNGLAFQKEVIP